MWQFLVMVSVADYVGHVYHTEQSEDERLQKTDERSQKIENYWNNDFCETGKDLDRQMVSSHIAQKS